MKKLALILGFICVCFSSAYIFALPPLLKIALQTELGKNNIELLALGNISMKSGQTIFTDIALQDGRKEIKISKAVISRNPLLLVVLKNAAKIEIQKSEIFIDGSVPSGQISEHIKSPHKYLAQLANNYIIGVKKNADNVTLKDLKFDYFSDAGLLSYKGDIVITGDKIVAHVNAIQKQLTFNAKIDGAINAAEEKISLNIHIDNLNANFKNLSIKRGQGQFIHRQSKENRIITSQLNGEMQAGMLQVNDFKANYASVKINAAKANHRIYVTGALRPDKADMFEYWLNFQDESRHSHFKVENALISDITKFYWQNDNDAQPKNYEYSTLVERFFMKPAEVNIQSHTENNNTSYNLSFIMQDKDPLFKAQIIKQRNETEIAIEPYNLTSTQVNALWHYFMSANANRFNFKGEAQLSGSAKIAKDSRGLKLANEQSNPLSIYLSNANLVTNDLKLQAGSGRLVLAEGRSATSSLEYKRLSANGLNLNAGKIHFYLSPIDHMPKLSQLRTGIGGGHLIINQDQTNNSYQISGKRVHSDSLPQGLWPSALSLKNRVDIKASLITGDNGQLKFKERAEIKSISPDTIPETYIKAMQKKGIYHNANRYQSFTARYSGEIKPKTDLKARLSILPEARNAKALNINFTQYLKTNEIQKFFTSFE